MHELYVGREAWKNENMAVSDAKQWLTDIPLDHPNLTTMLERVAKGDYPRIQNDLTNFIIAMINCKHKHSETAINYFVNTMLKDVLDKIELNRLPKSMRDLLTQRSFN